MGHSEVFLVWTLVWLAWSFVRGLEMMAIILSAFSLTMSALARVA